MKKNKTTILVILYISIIVCLTVFLVLGFAYNGWDSIVGWAISIVLVFMITLPIVIILKKQELKKDK